MTFSFFLSIYSRCGAPASWAARHTTVCLDIVESVLVAISIERLPLTVLPTEKNYKLTAIYLSNAFPHELVISLW